MNSIANASQNIRIFSFPELSEQFISRDDYIKYYVSYFKMNLESYTPLGVLRSKGVHPDPQVVSAIRTIVVEGARKYITPLSDMEKLIKKLLLKEVFRFTEGTGATNNVHAGIDSEVVKVINHMSYVEDMVPSLWIRPITVSRKNLPSIDHVTINKLNYHTEIYLNYREDVREKLALLEDAVGEKVYKVSSEDAVSILDRDLTQTLINDILLPKIGTPAEDSDLPFGVPVQTNMRK